MSGNDLKMFFFCIQPSLLDILLFFSLLNSFYSVLVRVELYILILFEKYKRAVRISIHPTDVYLRTLNV